ncbi:MAG: SDR family oxidoreductase [Chitinophagaceae bacterium]
MNIIITGASKGMGRAIADKFASRGHNLILCARNEVQLYTTMQELLNRFPGITVKAKPVDLSDKSQAKDFGGWVLSEIEKLPGGTVDVLVNNAGRFLPGSVHNEEEGVFEKMIEVNVSSAYHLTRVILPKMMSQKKGHIFNICSIAALNAYANGGSYSISKFALLGFSRNLREEMKPHGIKVTAVMPGAVYTDSWSGSNVQPARIMESADIAELIFSCSQLSPQAVVEDLVIRPQLGDL